MEVFISCYLVSWDKEWLMTNSFWGVRDHKVCGFPAKSLEMRKNLKLAERMKLNDWGDKVHIVENGEKYTMLRELWIECFG